MVKEKPLVKVKHRTVNVDGVDVFYREAGDPADPTLLLLHGFPTSSHMFRNLIPALADGFHLVAPDYPGFGNSDFPPREEFEYTFDHLAEVVEAFIGALGLEKFSLYIQDYGAPIGLRIATANPERVEALIVQSGNAYEEGFVMPFWEPIFAYAEERSPENEAALRGALEIDAHRWQYTHGVRDAEAISPDNWNLDQRFLDRPGNKEVQLDLFYDYQFNIPRYPAFQEYFRAHRPPTLITWGKNDEIFGVAGAEAYKRDLPDAELHLLDTGHFALEEDLDAIAGHIRRFLGEHLSGKRAARDSHPESA
ncbi:MAG: Hydrolase, alpha/beta fold family [uncultured Rubrobacteraceae bacterium]|uniref:Hydrolase, alpha/beta fold family n=1 Tax=uncultured Rubrobacteraceae bacterium TaxID=349277 RepID=A0A6J4PR21_9ACTN|nr:MAG: Hydrolase, alpha/beta fold family [uncultured Rubrobacteraceae bacterium]